MASIRNWQGKFQVRWRDPLGVQRSKVFDRRTDARAFSVKVESDKQRGTYVNPADARTPFGEWVEDWFGGKLNLRSATRARDESLLRNHVLPTFGRVPIGQITPQMVQSWMVDLAGQRKPRTVRECYRLLSSALKAAVGANLISHSPCSAPTGLPRVERKKERFLSPAQVHSLALAIDTAYRALVYTAAYLGCRWGELAGLKRENLDLLRGQVRIVGSLERVGGTVRYVEDTKTSAGRRTITIPKFLIEILADHLAYAPTSEFVFTGPDGGLLRESNFRKRQWKPAVERAGLEPLTFHDLRHTCAAILIEQGAHPLEIQRRLGHADIRTTMNVYGHLFPNLDERLTARLDDVFHATGTSAASAK